MSARTMLAITLALALAAVCGDTPVAPADRPPPDPVEGLTADESVALFRGIARLSFADADALHPGSLVIECPKGGQMELIETIEEFEADGGRPEIDVAFTILPAQCQLRSQGNLFILDGNPGLRSEMHLEAGTLGFGEAVYITGTITGDLDWQLHLRSGGCPNPWHARRVGERGAGSRLARLRLLHRFRVRPRGEDRHLGSAAATALPGLTGGMR